MALSDDADIEALIAAYKAGASASSLSRDFQVSTWTVIERLKAAGVRIRSNKEQNEKRLNLVDPGEFVGLVDGLLLGDGWIDRKGLLRLEQGEQRRGWVGDVAKRLEKFGATSKQVKIPPRDKILAEESRVIRGHGGVLLYTPAYVELQEQRLRWYPEGTKRVPLDIRLTPLTLAYWFAGDGSFNPQGALVFYTNGFTKSEVEMLASKLRELDVHATAVSAQRPNEFKVMIYRRDDAVRFQQLVEPYLPECCLYKLQHVRPAIPRGEPQRLLRKLSPEQVEEVRQARARGDETMSALAGRFGVSVSTLYNTLKTKRTDAR